MNGYTQVDHAESSKSRDKAPQSSTVTLAFGTGQSWDDTELISAYDAAMSEFHALHPGPGSWLDKATAALAAGRTLPGSEPNGRCWYTTVNNPQIANSKQNSSVSLPHDNSNPRQDNPYVSSTDRGGHRRPSPSYEPPSPSSHQHIDAAPQNAPFRPLHVEVSFEDAISYAMQAQYSAGYWMGLAHGKRSQGFVGTEPVATAPTNVFNTQRRYDVPSQGIKR